jgi:O-antigen/teichoic acid export membrane protein
MPDMLPTQTPDEHGMEEKFSDTATLPIDKWPTQPMPAITGDPYPLQQVDTQSLEEMEALLEPSLERISETGPHPAVEQATGGYKAVARNMVKSSGIYALASLGPPLVSLVLAPFLTHQLSPDDYGILAVLTTVIGLAAGITQVGMASAFFRVYTYEYSEAADRRSVLASVMLLLPLFAVPFAVVASLLAPALADVLLDSSSLGGLIALAAWVVVAQNLTVPGFAWLRAENHPLFFSILSISNILIALLANLVLLGLLHWGVAGSLVATGSGYAAVALCTLPFLLWRSGAKVRREMIWSLLTFGAPQVLSYVSYWVLQLSDRYLLSRFVSLDQVASYSIAYTLGGSVLSVLVISPFSLAWPAAMFSVAKRKDAPQMFRLIFRWLSLILLFAAFGVSIASTLVLDWLFPVEYHASAPIIPVIAESLVFYGLYIIFMAGANIRRKTWMPAAFTGLAALVNVLLNLVLIPFYGAAGAAAATLIAYIVLTGVAYVANQRIYPVPYQVKRFGLALVLGLVLYVGSQVVSVGWSAFWRVALTCLCLVVYGACLLYLVGGIQLLRARGAQMLARALTIRKGS